jgi:hypothetical protein
MSQSNDDEERETLFKRQKRQKEKSISPKFDPTPQIFSKKK